MNVSNIAYSSVNIIVKEVFDSYRKGVKFTVEKVKTKLSDPYFHDEQLVQDVRDGDCFRGNKYFSDNPDAVPLILFADELEVCNPLGAGKTKHKINCTYFSTFQIQPALRSKVNPIQLVSLVTSKVWKKHGNHLCNERLIEDLKVLETEGVEKAEIEHPTKTAVRAGLQYIVGDNLGQHTIAELNQSFSSGNICRWCKVTYDEACRKGLAY